MFVENYIDRSIELDELSLYEFVMKFEVFCYGKSKKLKKGKMLCFVDNRLGSNYACIKKGKRN